MLSVIISTFYKVLFVVPAVLTLTATPTNMQLATKIEFTAVLLLDLRYIEIWFVSGPAG